MLLERIVTIRRDLSLFAGPTDRLSDGAEGNTLLAHRVHTRPWRCAPMSRGMMRL